MREIGIKELKNTASRVIEEVESGERIVVTKRGRPTALILSMEDAEDFVLAYADEYVEMRQQGRREYEEGKSVSRASLKRLATQVGAPEGLRGGKSLKVLRGRHDRLYRLRATGRRPPTGSPVRPFPGRLRPALV